jgi:hypothetical protein
MENNNVLDKSPLSNLSKAPYEKPVLRIFGRVADLTRGGNGSSVDAQKPSGASPSHPVFG